MRVSELKEGMLIRPKKGCAFRQFSSLYEGGYQCLECHKRPSRMPRLSNSPVVYLGRAPKHRNVTGSYEARHWVFVTSIGMRLRVAPEAWRNMEPIDD